jgi:ParB-like chromosome segregation protein Spo0J
MVRAITDIIGKKGPRPLNDILEKHDPREVFFQPLEQGHPEAEKIRVSFDGLKEDTRKKMANSIYMADQFGIRTDSAFLMHDSLTNTIFEGETPPSQAFLKFKESEQQRKGILKTVSHAYNQAGVRMTKGVAGLARLEGEVSRAVQEKFWGNFGLEPPFDLAKKMGEWGTLMTRASNQYFTDHPEEAHQITYGGGFWNTTRQYLQRPENILQGALEAVPMLMEAYLGHVTGTTAAKYAGTAPKLFPWLGRVIGLSAPITAETYTDAREFGAPIQNALPQAILTGFGEGIIEEWTLGQKVRIFKNVGAAAKKGIAATAAQILLGGGKAYARGTAEEWTQGVNRNFWQMVFSDPDQEVFAGVTDEAASGGLVELFMSGSFAAAGKGVQLTREQQVSRVEAIRDQVAENDYFTDEQKEEIDTELDRVLAEEIEEEEPEAPTAKEAEVPTGKEIGPIKGADKVLPQIASKKEFWENRYTKLPKSDPLSTAPVPNTDSISAELGHDFEELSGIRNVPASDFSSQQQTVAADDIRRAKELAKEIKEEGLKSPLIVVVDKKGPFVLEGGHRVDALFEIGADTIPALVVLDTKSLDELAQAKPPTAPKVEVPAPEAKAKKLRSTIHAVATKKGLTKKRLTELKKKHTGYNKLTGKISQAKITTEQLENLLKAVKRARPKKVGHKNVISKKTEGKIEKLKNNLIDKAALTESSFDKILAREVHGREPKYIDGTHFITEKEGKEIIKRMIDESITTRQVESMNRAIRQNPAIAEAVSVIKTKPVKKRDPFRLESMRYYAQQSENVTDSPIYTSYQELINTHLETVRSRTNRWRRIEGSTPDYAGIIKNDAAVKRVSDYIAAQSNLEGRPKSPENITEGEMAVAKEIQEVLKEYEYKVRTAKFYNFYYYNQPIPDAPRFAKEIRKAVDIFESEGREALVEYLKTQTWGVINSGYEPLQVYMPKIQTFKLPPAAVGKGHVKMRLDIEYSTQERNIFQRLGSYMRQIDLLFNLHPQIQAFVRLYDDNLTKFKEPKKAKQSIEGFLKNLKKYNIEEGFFERMIARLYSQAMQAVIMPSPVLAFRNTLQNAAFEHDKSILIDPRNKRLTAEDVEYLETYVLQTKPMIREYFMSGEQPLPGLGALTRFVERIALYPHSDIFNRNWSFWAKKNQVDRAPEGVKEMMRYVHFDDMTNLEQQRALGILARDGKDAMGRYIARVHVDDIHFLYERAQRSPAEQTTLGRVVGNLALFPRAYTEKLAHALTKLRADNYQEQWRGLKILLSVVAGGIAVGAFYTKVTGRRRNPYNPLELFAFRPGGLLWASVDKVGAVYSDMVLAIGGDKRALAALTTAIPETANMFIPLYDITLRGYEALTDQKNVDRKALRQIRMIIDNEYEIRGGAYRVRRNAIESWQYFIGGAGIDQEIQKKVEGRKAI